MYAVDHLTQRAGDPSEGLSFCTCSGSEWEGRTWCTCTARDRPVQTSRGHAGVMTCPCCSEASPILTRGAFSLGVVGEPATAWSLSRCVSEGLRASDSASDSGPAGEPSVWPCSFRSIALTLPVALQLLRRPVSWTASVAARPARPCASFSHISGVKSTRQASFGILSLVSIPFGLSRCYGLTIRLVDRKICGVYTLSYLL